MSNFRRRFEYKKLSYDYWWINWFYYVLLYKWHPNLHYMCVDIYFHVRRSIRLYWSTTKKLPSAVRVEYFKRITGFWIVSIKIRVFASHDAVPGSFWWILYTEKMLPNSETPTIILLQSAVSWTLRCLR